MPMTSNQPLSIARMRAVDQWLGLPLCTLVGAFLKVSPWPARSLTLPAQPRRILIMKFFGLGSIVQIAPALRAIRRRYPESQLIFLTFQETAGVVRRLGVCDDLRVIRTATLAQFGRDVVQQIARFGREPVDICVDLEFFSKFSTLMSAFSGAPTRVAFHLNNFWRRSVVTHPVYYNYYRHVRDAYAGAAAALDAVPAEADHVGLELPAETSDLTRQRLMEGGWDGRTRLVGINANAGELSLERRWPREHFIAVIERLCAKADVQPVLTGSLAERPYVEQLIEQLNPEARQRVVDVAGRLSLDEFAAALARCEFLVTNDSGPLHIANAQGIDTISLWGVTRPSFYGPQRGNHSTFYRHLPCSPCLNTFTSEVGQWCAHRADCMQQISVDEVWPTIEAYLETPTGERERVVVRQGW